MSNLTTLANLKAWLNVTTTTDDALLNRLIAQASNVIRAYLQRGNLFQQVYNDTYDGSGSARQILRNWPVLSVASVTINTVAIPAAPAYGQSGFLLESWDGSLPGRPQAVNVSGYIFSRGFNNAALYSSGLGNVQITYTAGYAVQNETQTIPATPYQLTALGPLGSWAADQGVTYTAGGSLTLVTGTPSAGQYSVANGVYTFAAADTGKSVLLNYSYVPFDIEQACIEMAAERYRYKDRIGQSSKTLGGQETMAFSLKDMQDYIKLSLQPYRRVIIA